MGVPKKPLHLPTNYRTHSGILNAAAAVVDVLRHQFPRVSYTVLVPKPSDNRLFSISIALTVHHYSRLLARSGYHCHDSAFSSCQKAANPSMAPPNVRRTL